MLVSKIQSTLLRLDLDAMSYTIESTFVNLGSGPRSTTGIFRRSAVFHQRRRWKSWNYVYDGFNYTTLLEATSAKFIHGETAGITFSPDRCFMVFCIQEQDQCVAN
jgi:hypothetical protein